jgi:hypothetical protein
MKADAIKKMEIVMLGIVTAVFEKRKGRWLIMQSHFAMPFTGQAGGQSFPGAPVGA